MTVESKSYPPDPERARHTHAGSVENYNHLLSQSQRDPDQFWASVASELDWFKPWDEVRRGGFPHFEYFSGGITNPCHNLVDRHIAAGQGNRLALIWEGENFEERCLSYTMLHAEVCRFSNVLKGLGIKKGDAVAVFLPNLVETVISVSAISKIALPQKIFFAEALPKTPNGKIMRRLLAEIAEKGSVTGDISGVGDISMVEKLIANVHRAQAIA